MKKFDWDESLATGITRVDEQHREWIERINRLAVAIATNQQADHIAETLNFMVSYSDFHFAAEEELMAAHGYPALEQHRQAHRAFRKELTHLLTLQIGQPDALRRISDSITPFQIAWLKNPITTADRAFGEFLDRNVSEEYPESA